MEFFGATAITRKIILEGGLFVVDDGSGSGSSAAVGANDTPLIIFEITSHYDYDHIRNCGLFIATYAKYLGDELQVPNDGLDVGLLHKRYAALLWKYGEAKAQKPYKSDIKYLRRPKPNSVAPNEE
ncbi:hypothetical protein BC332_24369 [Capsicum chinense]|nr:hypothetical protein BC332_24369 [Capsicum chinense]